MARSHAFWVILAGAVPTAFRSPKREDLLPTLHQLQRKQPDVTLQWFDRGKLWESPEAARAALLAKRPPYPDRKATWRPGGSHKDPRARYQLSRDEKRARFKKNLGRPPLESRSDKPFDSKSDRPPESRPPRPGGPPRDRWQKPGGPPRDRWQKPGPPSGGRWQKPGGPPSNRWQKPSGPPSGDRWQKPGGPPAGDRWKKPKPFGKRPFRPYGDRPDRPPGGDRPGRPPGDRPGRPPGAGAKPFGGRPPGGGRKPFGRRPPGKFRPPGPRGRKPPR